MTSLLTAPTDPQAPTLVEGYLERVLPPEAHVPRSIRIAQTGEMWMKPGGRALRFDAVEELAVATTAFRWRATVHVAPFVSMRIVDTYAAGKGALDGRLFGLPVVDAHGSATDEGEALRYLAELAWVPQAMRANRELEWREVEEDIVEVSTTVGSTKVAVGLRFDQAGDILAAFSHRPRLEGTKTVSRPWLGVFSDYAELGGIRIPTRAEVHWELPDGPFTYWRGRVTALELLDDEG